VTVLCHKAEDGDPRDGEGGIEVVRLPPLPGGLLASLAFGAGLTGYLARRGRDFDLYHVNLASSPALFVAPWAGYFRKPALLKFGASGPFGDAHTSRSTARGRWKLRRLRGAFKRYLCPNPEIVREFVDLGYSREDLVVFPNGVDTDFFRPAAHSEREQLRESRGWSGRFVTVFTGRLEPQKNLRFLLECWQVLAADHPEALLVLAGAGSQEASLRNLVEKRGMGEQIRFPGALDAGGVRELLQAADSFVLPSLAEGMSNALLEAMACGVPVVASDISGNGDLIDHPVAGYLFPPSDGRALGEALRALLASPEQRRRIGAAGRARVRATCSIRAVGERYLEIVEGLLGR